MENQTTFASLPWFTAEGQVNEKPCMFRGRQIPDKLIGNSSLPNIFVVSFPFDIADSTGLPTQAQYKAIEIFERQVLDPIEVARLGVVAFVKTFDGVVQYYFYVSNTELVANTLRISRPDIEMAAGEDPQWSEYRAFLRGMHHERVPDAGE